MKPNGSHNDRRRRRDALSHPRMAAGPRESWWRRLLEIVRSSPVATRLRGEKRALPRPTYGRGGAERKRAWDR